MKNFDLFDGIDEKALESLSQEFPVLTDEEKERIYFMSARRYNNYKNNNSDTTFSTEEDVKGVERYKRPKMRTASIAAAAAFIIGAGSFGGYNIAKQLSEGNGEVPDVNQNVTEDIAQAQTETATDPRTEEYRSTAESLISEFEDFLDPYIDEELPEYPQTDDVDISGMSNEEREAYAQQIEEEYSKYSDEIWFEVGRGDPFDHPNYDYIDGYYYNHYETGMKYSNTDEVMEKALSFMSQSCIDRQFPDLIGEDLTNYETDRIYDCDTEETPSFGVFAMYNGKLYCDCENYDCNAMINSAYYFYNRKDEPIDITDIEDDSFTACVKYEFTSVPNKYDMTMKVVNIDGKWIIDELEPTGPEPDQQKLDIIDKIMNSCNYYDKISCKYSWATRADSELTNGDVLPHCNLQSGVGYADNTTNKEYTYSDDGNDYDKELDIDSLLEYSKSYDGSEDEKINETYCDGEKYYYWVNPNEYDDGWYHWTNYIPHDNTFSLDNLIIDSFHQVSSNNRDTNMLGPNGQHLVYDYLYDFSIWDITGDVNFEGRDCYIIDINAPSYCTDSDNILVAYHYDSIKLYIDKETGIPMAEEYSKEGRIEKCEIYYDVRINDEAEPVPEIDMNSYDTSLFTYK